MSSTRKENKGSDLAYGMVSFPGSRQAPGPTEAAMSLLKRDGFLREDEAPQTSDDEKIEPGPIHTAVNDDPDAPHSTSPAAPKPRRSTKRKSAPSGARRKPSEALTRPKSAFVLPPTDEERGPTRSLHCRIPPLIERHLKELTDAHRCTRTHVICAAIEAEWQRFKRRRPRRGDAADPPAT
jgi:hypothetical protein